MKSYIYLILLLIGAFGCSNDDSPANPNLLNFDGPNATSPALPIGDYEAAAHFNANFVADYQNKELIAIDYFMYNIADRVEVRVSESLGSSLPGNIIFSRDVTNEIIPFSWNTVNLGAPISISGGLWLSVYFENSVDNLQIIGCDGGPGQANGDWLYDSFDDQFASYRSRTGESINWNIQGVLQDR
jgi:hypothetical protein